MSFLFVSERELARFRANASAVTAYKEGIHLLRSSGLIDLLRIFARPYTVDGGANPYMAAHNGAKMEGYQQCLDDLIYFEEKYLQEKLSSKLPIADFGGLASAVAQKKITLEEAKKIRSKGEI